MAQGQLGQGIGVGTYGAGPAALQQQQRKQAAQQGQQGTGYQQQEVRRHAGQAASRLKVDLPGRVVGRQSNAFAAALALIKQHLLGAAWKLLNQTHTAITFGQCGQAAEHA